MKATLSDNRLVLAYETPEKEDVLTYWRFEEIDPVLVLDQKPDAGFAIKSLGDRFDLCREPINVKSNHPDEVIKTTGNSANTIRT